MKNSGPIVGIVLGPDVSNLAVFGQNLRALCATKPSISSVCRDLGINRVQFNRYLIGRSFPKPDVLVEICEYFEVDAHIFVEPLSRKHFKSSTLTQVDGVSSHFVSSLQTLYSYFEGYDFRLAEDFIPDGFYVAWRRSFASPDQYTAMLLRVESQENLKTVKFFDRRHRDLGGSMRHSRDPKAGGVIFGHPAGALMVDMPRDPNAKATGLVLLNPFDYMLGVYPALSIALAAVSPERRRAVKMLLQPIRNEMSSVLFAARRGRYLITSDMVPAPFLKWLEAGEV
jgi:transcriptional regulator with XRE-family HTH domain